MTPSATKRYIIISILIILEIINLGVSNILLLQYYVMSDGFGIHFPWALIAITLLIGVISWAQPLFTIIYLAYHRKHPQRISRFGYIMLGLNGLVIITLIGLVIYLQQPEFAMIY